MDEDLDRLTAPLAALMEWFRDADLRGTVIGGVAASLRGKPRLTNDVDALVVEADAEALLRTGTKFGFTPRIADAVEFSRHTRVLLLRYQPGEVDIDLSLGALPFEDEVIERSTWIRAGNIRIRLASAEDLIIMKAVAGRPRDVTDIENVIAANPDLDVERIRRWVREFSAVLDMPEIHSNLEILLKRRTARR
ncbi:MAG TPA: nucleotidyl transferase AbiEii/AbiGii toxin family protein [Thermoanaerobaculia bacterium]|jgi:predicted nucleotidyltransferase|nr:nucleotidyl transferase AbiEii/AbiGii toxin family protein [Thermoanaerobaculia bacterium]